jgi:hypothetical protein
MRIGYISTAVTSSTSRQYNFLAATRRQRREREREEGGEHHRETAGLIECPPSQARELAGTHRAFFILFSDRYCPFASPITAL